MKKKTIISWLPFVVVSIVLIAMGLAVGIQNREWQIENGYAPMNNDWPFVFQIICYWIAMMFGWLVGILFIWMYIGPLEDPY